MDTSTNHTGYLVLPIGMYLKGVLPLKVVVSSVSSCVSLIVSSSIELIPLTTSVVYEECRIQNPSTLGWLLHEITTAKCDDFVLFIKFTYLQLAV